ARTVNDATAPGSSRLTVADPGSWTPRDAEAPAIHCATSARVVSLVLRSRSTTSTPVSAAAPVFRMRTGTASRAPGRRAAGETEGSWLWTGRGSVAARRGPAAVGAPVAGALRPAVRRDPAAVGAPVAAAGPPAVRRDPAAVGAPVAAAG